MLAAAWASLALAASWANAGITLNSSSTFKASGNGSPNGTFTPFTGVSAGSASKLVVAVSTFNGSGGLAIGSITFGGVLLTKAIEYDAPYNKNNNNYKGLAAVWYLDSPAGTGDIVVVVSGGANNLGGIVASYMLLSGTAGGVSSAVNSDWQPGSSGSTASVTLNNVPANSLVVAQNDITSSSFAPTASSPLTQVGNGNTGTIGGATGYVNSVSGTVTPSFTSLSGSVVITVAAAFAPAATASYTTWAAGPFPSGKTLTDTNPAHDFDGGGLPTGIEWVTGGDPTNPADDASVTPTFDNTSDPAYFIFTYRRTTAANTDANTTVKVEYGSNLSGWTPAVGDGTNTIITTTIGGGGSGIDLVHVKIKRTLAAAGKLFARLNVAVTTP